MHWAFYGSISIDLTLLDRLVHKALKIKNTVYCHTKNERNNEAALNEFNAEYENVFEP